MSQDAPINVPESVILLLGIGVPETRLVARALGSHDKVDLILEPSHSRLEENFTSTDPAVLARECGVPMAQARTWVVAESLARVENAEHGFRLLEHASRAGTPCVVVLILRSPVDSLLSEGCADETGIDRHWKEVCGGLRVVLEHVFGYTHRVVLYPEFLKRPGVESKRLMASIGYGFESKRRPDFENAHPTPAAEIHRILARIKDAGANPTMIGFHRYLGSLAKARLTDTEILQGLFLNFGEAFGLSAKKDGRHS